MVHFLIAPCGDFFQLCDTIIFLELVAYIQILDKLVIKCIFSITVSSCSCVQAGYCATQLGRIVTSKQELCRSEITTL